MSERVWSGFFYPCTPAGKPSARHARTGVVYIPKETKAFMAALAEAARAAFPAPIAGPVSARIDIFLQRPQRLCRQKDPDGILPAPVKPDVDNIQKVVLDGLKGVAFFDDSQVTDLHVTKRFTSKTKRGPHGHGHEPGIYILAAPDDFGGPEEDGE